MNNFRYADDTILMAKIEEELKSLLLKVKEDSEKAGLKLIQKTKITASSPITSWQIGKMETVTDFIFLGSKSLQMVTTAMKLKDSWLPGRKLMRNLDSILKNKDITLLTKVHIFKTMVFPVVTYRCELDHKKDECLILRLMLSNCSSGEDSWESLGQQGDKTSQS